MMIRSCPKRLLAFALAMLMVCSTVLPAAATGETACSLTEGCTLTEGHDGACQLSVAETEPETSEPETSEPESTVPETTAPPETEAADPVSDDEDSSASAQDLSSYSLYARPSGSTGRPSQSISLVIGTPTQMDLSLGDIDTEVWFSMDGTMAVEGALTVVDDGNQQYTFTATGTDGGTVYYTHSDGTVFTMPVTAITAEEAPQMYLFARRAGTDGRLSTYLDLEYDETNGSETASVVFYWGNQEQQLWYPIDGTITNEWNTSVTATDDFEGPCRIYNISLNSSEGGRVGHIRDGELREVALNAVTPVGDMTLYAHAANSTQLLSTLRLPRGMGNAPILPYYFVLSDGTNTIYLDDSNFIHDKNPFLHVMGCYYTEDSVAPEHRVMDVQAAAIGSNEAVFTYNGRDFSMPVEGYYDGPTDGTFQVIKDWDTNSSSDTVSLDYDTETGTSQVKQLSFMLCTQQNGCYMGGSVSTSGVARVEEVWFYPDGPNAPAHYEYTVSVTGAGSGSVTITSGSLTLTYPVNGVASTKGLYATDLSSGHMADHLSFVYDSGNDCGFSKPLKFMLGNPKTNNMSNITDDSIRVTGPLEIISTNFQENANTSPAFMEYVIVPTGIGEGTISYVQGTASYTMSVSCVALEDYPRTQLFGATPSSNQINPINPINVLVRSGPPMEFALLTSQGEFPTFLNDPSRLTWDDSLSVEPMSFREENGMGYMVYGITCTSFAGGNIYYTDEFGRVSSLRVNGITVDDLPPKELCLTDKGAYTPQDGISLVYNPSTQVSETREVSFWFGNFQTEDVEEVVDISRLDWGGVVDLEATGELWDGHWPVFRLSVNGIGEGWIQYTDPATGQTDTLYVYGVENPIRASSTDMLYTKTHAGDYYPALYTYFGPGYDNNGNLSSQPGSTYLQFYFGNPNGTSVNLFPDNLTTTGPIRVAPMGQGSYYDEDQQAYVVKVEGTGFGKGTVEYTVDGLTYCYLVTSQEDWAPSWEADGPANSITVKYGQGNSNVTVGIGGVIGYIDGSYSDTDMLTLIGNLRHDFDPSEPRDEHTSHLTLVALSNYGTSTEDTADQSFYDCISDVSFEVMSWQNDYGWDYDEYPVPATPTIRRETAGITTWAMPKQWDQFHAFTGQIAMRFTLTLNDTPKRYTMVHNLEAHQTSSITVYADDLTTAARLNTVLGNMQIMENWLKDKYPEEYRRLSEEGNITIVLPAVTYDALIVDHAARRAPLTSNTTGLILIQGSTDAAGNRTTMPGLLSSTGTGTSAISRIDFVADEDVTMTYRGETFTGGFLIDPTTQTFADAYDHEYLAAYDKRYDGSADYIPNPRAGNEWFGETQQEHGGVISECTFTGFDYALRSTDNGYTGSASACTFVDNEYAIYVDAKGIPYSGGGGSALFYENTFRDNRWAVTLRNLPQDITPYGMRFFDSIFEGNHKDFKVTTPGNKHYYYFYRNYYSGKSSDTMTLRSTSAAGSANIEVEGNGVPLTEPCRLTPDLSPNADNLWIFQDTGILNSEAGALLIPEAALPSRSLTIIDNENNDIAVWSFGTAD